MSASEACASKASAMALSALAFTLRSAAAEMQGSCWWNAEAAIDTFPILAFASASLELASAACTRWHGVRSEPLAGLHDT